MSPLPSAVERRASFAESLRTQILVILGAAVILPGILFWLALDRPVFTVLQINNSIVVATLAAALAIYFLRRMTAFPGVRRFRYILPCYAAAYGGLLAIVLIGRIGYSSIFLTASFVLSVIAALLLDYVLERRVVLRFYVVPFGRTGFIGELASINWIVLDEPCLPEDLRIPIVADLHYDLPVLWERMLADAALRGQPVYHVKQLRESLTGRVSIDHLSENNFGSLIPNLAYSKFKRLVDIVSVLIVLPLLAVPLALLAIAIRLESPGPALFRQARMGGGGKVFNVLKFRSMYERTLGDAPHAHRNDAVTVTDDARITRIGRVIRRSRIDELPQFINVLRGEMSLIGPRPEALPLSRWYEQELPFYVYRHIVRPGITGWAQVNQGHVADLESVTAKLQYDFYYIKNYSAWLDMLIAVRTIGIMLTGFGAK